MPQEFEEEVEYWHLIHNDLEAAVEWHAKQAAKKQSAGDTSGIFHDWLAALVFSAFTSEAYLNFVGNHVLDDGWPERASFQEKLALLNRHLCLGLDRGERPWQTLSKLCRVRNLLAHGRPEIGIERRTITHPETAEDLFAGLRAKWKDDVNGAFLEQCRNDIETLRNQLFEKANIMPFETKTRSMSSS